MLKKLKLLTFNIHFLLQKYLFTSIYFPIKEKLKKNLLINLKLKDC